MEPNALAAYAQICGWTLARGGDVCTPDLMWFEFLHELGEIAAAGGDIRDRVLGFPPETGSAD
jgi:hypothetical protein